MPKSLPILYKKTSTGAIQQWKIGASGTTITTKFGQVGGKIQTTTDEIKSGKSSGKKNATTPEQQAEKEAEAQWLKKKKAGYVESISDAESGKTDAVIEGGVLPTLAKVYEDHIEKITFPLSMQPKLDGHRCIAMIEANGEVSLWTRTRKRIDSVPHIVSKLEYVSKKMQLHVTARLQGSPVVLDGELYNHEMRNDFEKLTSAARKRGGNENSSLLQYHVYDMVAADCFSKRFMRLGDIILHGGREIVLVDTKLIQPEEGQEAVSKTFQSYLAEGYEGAMVRLHGYRYEHKRSASLLKVKEMQDAEFFIKGVKEGRGKLAGHGIFSCVTPDGQEFDVKMAGPTEELKKVWKHAEEYLGEMLTVQFQGFTKDGKPRFPVGLRVRIDL